jgi:RNA polymerase sigma-70 factor (ECF subfamily)
MSRFSAQAKPLTHPAEEPADDELVEAARSGDDTAFTRLFERHRCYVARLAGHLFPRHQDVEAIIQDTFTEAFLELDRYRGGHERSFVAWLGRITVTTSFDALRRARARREQQTEPLDDDEIATLNARWHGTAQTAEQALIMRDLALKLLGRLAPEDRAVLTLLGLDELSVAETAELTGWSAAKVKVRAHRARKALRAVLKGFL